MFLTDITSFIDDFMSFLLYMFRVFVSTLESFTFHGISLLDFTLGLVLIGLGLTIFVNIVRRDSSASSMVKSAIRKG